MRNFNVPSTGNVLAGLTLVGAVSLVGACSGGEERPEGPVNQQPAPTTPYTQMPERSGDSWLSTAEPIPTEPEASTSIDILPPQQPRIEPPRKELPSVASVILNSKNMCAWSPNYRMPLRDKSPVKFTLDGRCHKTGLVHNPDGDPKIGQVSISDSPQETGGAKMGEVPNGQIATGICVTRSDENTPAIVDGNGRESTRWVAVRFTNKSGEGIPQATGLVAEYVTGYAVSRTNLPNCSKATLEKIRQG